VDTLSKGPSKKKVDLGEVESELVSTIRRGGRKIIAITERFKGERDSERSIETGEAGGCRD